MSRERLKIYDPFPPDMIDAAIKACIKDRVQRMILHYKLVDKYTYEELTEVLEKELGHSIADKTIKRKVYEAESKLFPQLEIYYNGRQI